MGDKKEGVHIKKSNRIIAIVLIFAIFITSVVSVISVAVKNSYLCSPEIDTIIVANKDFEVQGSENEDTNIIDFDSDTYIWNKKDETYLEGNYVLVTGNNIAKYLNSLDDEVYTSSYVKDIQETVNSMVTDGLVSDINDVIYLHLFNNYFDSDTYNAQDDVTLFGYISDDEVLVLRDSDTRNIYQFVEM